MDVRLWSLHPKHLDPRGLVALWREGLLGQAVLDGRTSGYRHHPQLIRFQEHEQPLAAIGAYLTAVYAESAARGYRFDGSRVGRVGAAEPIAVADGQVEYEWGHLRHKVAVRAPDWDPGPGPEPHPLFRVVPGGVADWERAPR